MEKSIVHAAYSDNAKLKDIVAEFERLAELPETGKPIHVSRMHFDQWAKAIGRHVKNSRRKVRGR